MKRLTKDVGETPEADRHPTEAVSGNNHWIPKDWTFRDRKVAERFDRHVREQLPWYDIATQSVVHFARHYIPHGGVVYDIGASTGNIGRAIAHVLSERKAHFTAIEESAEMVEKYVGPKPIIVANAIDYGFQPFDFAVCFLVLMFIPIGQRVLFVEKLRKLIKPGGCILVVDKLNTPSGYFGTVARRLTMQWKVNTGVSAQEIIEKELSLAGYQRPIEPDVLLAGARQFFQFGEFAGWVLEAKEAE
jgi:tRNA (cmo5U34)-methyltransferase